MVARTLSDQTPINVVMGNIRATLQDSTTLNTLKTWELSKVASVLTTAKDLQSGLEINFGLNMPNGKYVPFKYTLTAPAQQQSPAALVLGSLSNHVGGILAAAGGASPIIYATGLYNSNKTFDMGDGTTLLLDSGITLSFNQGGATHAANSIGNVTLDVSKLLAVCDNTVLSPTSIEFPPYPPFTFPVEQLQNGLQHVVAVTSDGATVHTATLDVSKLLGQAFQKRLKDHLAARAAKPHGFKITQQEVNTACQVIVWAISASNGQLATGTPPSTNGTLDFALSLGLQLF